MHKCPRCHRVILEDDLNCPDCGIRIDTEKNFPLKNNDNPLDNKHEISYKPGRGSNKSAFSLGRNHSNRRENSKAQRKGTADKRHTYKKHTDIKRTDKRAKVIMKKNTQ